MTVQVSPFRLSAAMLVVLLFAGASLANEPAESLVPVTTKAFVAVPDVDLLRRELPGAASYERSGRVCPMRKLPHRFVGCDRDQCLPVKVPGQEHANLTWLQRIRESRQRRGS